MSGGQCQDCTHWGNGCVESDEIKECTEGPIHVPVEYDHFCGRFASRDAACTKPEEPLERLDDAFLARIAGGNMVGCFMGHEVRRLDRESLLAIISYMGSEVETMRKADYNRMMRLFQR